jgi:ferredoxin--NADP+ reductase
MDTVEAITADLGSRCADGPVPDIGDELAKRGIEHLDCESWNAICRAELELGASLGRQRVKINEWNALVAAGNSVPRDDAPLPTRFSASLSAPY